MSESGVLVKLMDCNFVLRIHQQFTSILLNGSDLPVRVLVLVSRRVLSVHEEKKGTLHTMVSTYEFLSSTLVCIRDLLQLSHTSGCSSILLVHFLENPHGIYLSCSSHGDLIHPDHHDRNRLFPNLGSWFNPSFLLRTSHTCAIHTELLLRSQ